MSTRIATLAVAAALAATAAGCGDKCNEQTPPVSQVPPGCTANAGAAIQVGIHVCPKCDQGVPTCVVRAENAAGGQILLEPVSEVCDPQSCPLPNLNTCPFATMNCAIPGLPAGAYTLVVNTPGAPENIPLTVVASGAPATACPF